MSDRTSIRDSIVNKMKEDISDTNRDTYITNLDKQVFGKNLFLSDIQTFPAVTVAIGPESPTYLPGGFRWNRLNLYFRIYVRSEDESDERLEELIKDVKNFLDLNEDIEYDIIKPGGNQANTEKGHATQMTLLEITTDEGILKPYGIAEILVSVLYSDYNPRFIR